MLKGVVFDLDHTLFDRYASLAYVVPEFFKSFKISKSFTREKAAALIIYADRNFVHLGWQRVLDFLDENGLFEEKPSLEQYSEFLLSSFQKISVPFYFAKPMLAELREMGLKIGLITNGRTEIQRAKLKNLELEESFDEIIVSGEIGYHKPDTKPFELMSERLGIEPFELMYVGDNPENDVEASRRAGYIPVWVKTTGIWCFDSYQKPELCVDNVSELPTLIKAKGLV